jgi:hypothetical protein
MSQPTRTGSADPIDLPVQTVPEWLSRAPAPPDREPWYYGFLEKYARVLLAYSLVAFSLISLLVLFPLLLPETSARVGQAVAANLVQAGRAAAGSDPVADGLAWLVVRLLIGLVIIGVVFLAFLLPILLGVAYILLSVDAARNLRALKRLDSRR